MNFKTLIKNLDLASTMFMRNKETVRVKGINVANWPKWTLILLGFFATIWYLIRVIPKPSRMYYPCQQATAPLRVGFIIFTTSLAGSIFSYNLSKKYFKKSRIALGVMFLVMCLGFSMVLFTHSGKKVLADFIGFAPQTPNNPLGVAQGIFPGRVVWTHDPESATWNGSGHWWDENYTNQESTNKLVTNAVKHISGQESLPVAWDTIFKFFNTNKGRGNHGYIMGEKISIKINMNNALYGRTGDNMINASPQMIYSALKTLVEDAGVPQECITVFDASRYISDNVYNRCYPDFPNVRYVDHVGGNGRIQNELYTDYIRYSHENGDSKGTLNNDLSTCFVDADYIINMAILKGHADQGVTLCAKNMFGALGIDIDFQKNAHSPYFNPHPLGEAQYMTFVDFMSHKDMGGKTLLWMIDALYGSEVVYGEPRDRWDMAPFNGDWPSSLFVSLDAVAIESVAMDFIASRWPNAADIEYADQYMHEAALANDPPSGTFYDPEQDGIGTPSLGVHEHWNNPTDKQYTRNLGTGNGIELVYIRSGSEDCSGVDGGLAYLDDCGNCVGGNTGEVPCVMDCNGDENGTAFIDECEICAGGNSGIEPNSTCNQQPYMGTPAIIPGKVEMEYYDSGGDGISFFDMTTENEGDPWLGDAVDIEECDEGGHNLGWVEAGEWVEYTIDVSETGIYDFNIRFATDQANKRMDIIIDKNPLALDIALTSTGGWQEWSTKTEEGLLLEKGLHVMRLSFPINNFNLNFIDIQPSVIDCNGDRNGNAYFDNCNNCVGGSSGLEPCSISQIVSLQSGWNLFSLHIEPNDSLVNLLFGEANVIKTENTFFHSTYNPIMNTLNNLSVSKGYYVHVSSSVEYAVHGSAINLSSLPILSLKRGWNLIPYPFSNTRNIDVIFASISNKIEQVKDFDGFYEPNGSSNSLSDLIPGKAYFIKVSEDCSLIYSE